MKKKSGIELQFYCFIDCFQRNKRRQPSNIEELKDFYQSREQYLDFSSFHFLKLEIASNEKIRVEYSMQNTKDILESIEIVCRVTESKAALELLFSPILRLPHKYFEAPQEKGTLDDTGNENKGGLFYERN